MSILGHLLGDGADTHVTEATIVRQSLETSKAGGVDFDTAWTTAAAKVGWHRGGGVSRHESVAAFARPRFERAYYGLDPSIRTCQGTMNCPAPVTPAGRGVTCDMHRHHVNRIDEVLTERQELIAA